MQQQKRQHGRPRGRGRAPNTFASRKAQQVLAERKKQARRLADMTDEERALWRV